MDAAAFSELTRTRRSIRDFDPSREIDEVVLKEILEDAKWAPSWCNTQPFHLCLARAEQKDRIKEALLKKFDDAGAAKAGGWLSKLALWLGGGAPDGDYDTQVMFTPQVITHSTRSAVADVNGAGTIPAGSQRTSKSLRLRII